MTPEREAELLVKEARIDAFAKFVNSEKFSISREVCAIMLGFTLKEDSESAKDNCSDGNSKLD